MAKTSKCKTKSNGTHVGGGNVQVVLDRASRIIGGAP
jgi:hypothetical protein